MNTYPESELLAKLDYDTGQNLLGLDYDYGDLGDLRPGSEKHDKIVRLVLDYAREGYANNEDAIPECEKIDRILDGFMPADEVDAIRAGADSRKPVNVINPMLYAHHQQYCAAMQRAFFSGNTFHRFAGGGSAVRSAKAALAQKLLWRLCGWFKGRRNFDIHCSDAFAYPRAFMWGKWSKKTAPRKRTETVDDNLSMALNGMGVPYAPGDTVSYIDDDEKIIQEGTEWIPLDPYQVLVDRVTPDRFQESAFFGWVAEQDALLLVKQEDDPEEHLFNCAGLAIIARKGIHDSQYWRETSARSERINNNSDPRTTKSNNTTTKNIYMFCRVIPRDLGLSESTVPQVWFFTIGADKILIRAKHVWTLHGGIPVVCSSPNARGHQFAPVSNLGINYGQQLTVDFYVKQETDYQDLVKSGAFILDNTMLEWGDWLQTGGGGPRIIRMKKRAMGKPIGEFYHQIRTENVTDQNYNKAQWILEMAREGGGLSEPGEAMPDHAGSQGIKAIEARSISRMARFAIIIDEQARSEMARQELCNAAQWMSSEVMVDILGSEDAIIRQAYGLPPDATGLLLGHWDIEPDLDVVPLAAFGADANDPAALAELMKTLMAASPEAVMEFAQSFRIPEIIAAGYRANGVTDIDSFRYNLHTVPDQAVLQQVQAGNLVPMSQVMGDAA